MSGNALLDDCVINKAMQVTNLEENFNEDILSNSI